MSILPSQAGLAMARTCDVRRRIATLRARVFASAFGPRTVAAVGLFGLVSLALFAGVRAALAVLSQEGKETDQPATMSAEEFGRLSPAEQRALLVRAFQRRLDHAKNLHYESDEVIKSYRSRDGKPVEPLRGSPPRHSSASRAKATAGRCEFKGFRGPP